MNYRALHDTVEAALDGRDDVCLLSLLRPHKNAFLDLFKEYTVRAHCLNDGLFDIIGLSKAQWFHTIISESITRVQRAMTCLEAPSRGLLFAVQFSIVDTTSIRDAFTTPPQVKGGEGSNSRKHVKGCSVTSRDGKTFSLTKIAVQTVRAQSFTMRSLPVRVMSYRMHHLNILIFFTILVNGGDYLCFAKGLHSGNRPFCLQGGTHFITEEKALELSDQLNLDEIIAVELMIATDAEVCIPTASMRWHRLLTREALTDIPQVVP
eukprot:1178321-Prorocentrum_minimum.AAC.2